ncbi:hypothetical protein EYC80_010914 [Monilinia laxa]|uniref:Uncharacterized protein n=1 Tax=Monilinia laxa TaxID=61186 RepID=A0A5N6JQ70_MONLA|nr:hypothetical protein EYC80_010914 [Monilinia laxa]
MSHGVYASGRERRNSFWYVSESGDEDLTNSCSVFSADIKAQQDEVTEDEVDLSEDAEMQESYGVLRNMIDVEKEINEYASVSLSDLMMGYEDKDGKGHNRPLSRFRNKAHSLNSMTLTGVTRNMILGLYELIQFKVRDDVSESMVFEQLDPKTFSFNNPSRIWKDASESLSGSQFKYAKGSRTYVFVAALKFFITKLFNSSDGLTPDTFCALNRLLASTNKERGTRKSSHSKWYTILSAECHCEEETHSWLIQFIDRINSYNEINKLDPIYEISRLYLAFVERNYFGKYSRDIGMILIQSLALKWMHYVSIPFDEKEKEFQNVMMMPSNTAAPRLALFLEKSLSRNIERILSRLSGASFQVEDSNTTPTTEDTESPVTADSQDTNDRISSDSYISIINTGLLLEGVSSSLESTMELQRPHFEDSLAERKETIPVRSSAFQFQISTLKCCKTPKYRRDPPPTRKNSCETYYTNYSQADGYHDYKWNLVDKDLFNSPRLVPIMRKLSSGADIIKSDPMECLPEVKASWKDGDDYLDSQLESHRSTQDLLRSAKCNPSAFFLDEDKATISRFSPMLLKIMRDCSLSSS